jgi:glycosyltransferase involved in cell wall biosynthesis
MHGIEFKAFFGTDMSVRGYRDEGFGTRVAWDTSITAGYSHAFLSTDPRIQRVGAWTPTARGLGREFRLFRPDVVVLTAYGGGFHLGALALARRIGARVVMRHEASDVAASRSIMKSMVRDIVLRRLYAHVDRFAVIGKEAFLHLRRLGVPEAKLGSAPYCVDSDFFAGEVTRWSSRREEVRRQLDIGPADIALVFSGKLIRKKDPLLIPAAVACLPKTLRRRLHLLVAGDGELRPALETMAREVFGPRVHFFGFLNQSEIGRAYAAGDVLVLPSRRGAGETWGLVVNEAMQFGLSMVVSDGVGCAADLVYPETGRVFPSGDVAAAAQAIEYCIGIHQHLGSNRNKAAMDHVADYSAGAAARGLASIMRGVAGDPEL